MSSFLHNLNHKQNTWKTDYINIKYLYIYWSSSAVQCCSVFDVLSEFLVLINHHRRAALYGPHVDQPEHSQSGSVHLSRESSDLSQTQPTIFVSGLVFFWRLACPDYYWTWWTGLVIRFTAEYVLLLGTVIPARLSKQDRGPVGCLWLINWNWEICQLYLLRYWAGRVYGCMAVWWWQCMNCPVWADTAWTAWTAWWRWLSSDSLTTPTLPLSASQNFLQVITTLRQTDSSRAADTQLLLLPSSLLASPHLT